MGRRERRTGYWPEGPRGGAEDWGADGEHFGDLILIDGFVVCDVLRVWCIAQAMRDKSRYHLLFGAPWSMTSQ